MSVATLFMIIKTWKQPAAAKSLQSCPTLCDLIDGSPPGSPIPEILQARTLEWVSISFSNACKWKVKVKSLSRVRLLATPWTAVYLALPSMGFSRQEYWSGVPLPSPWKQPKCPSIDEWIKTLWYIYIIEYYSAINKNEIMPFAATWIDLDIMFFIFVIEECTRNYYFFFYCPKDSLYILLRGNHYQIF